MPRIPTYEQQTVARGTLAPPSSNGGEYLAHGIGQLAGAAAYAADVLDRQREREASAQAAVTLGRMQSDWTQQLYEKAKNIEPGAPEFTPQVLKEFDDYASKALGEAKTPASRAFLQERTAQYRISLAGQAMQIEAGERDRYQKQQFGEAIDSAATSAELDPNPDAWKTRLAEQTTLIENSGMGPTEIAAWKKTAQDEITQRAAVAAARANPTATLARLAKPAENDVLFRSLTPKARDAVLNETESQQRAAWSAEEHAYTVAKRAETDMHDAASKDGDHALANGTLTTQWIEANRKRLSPDDYRYFYGALGGGHVGGAGAGAAVYADLRERASAGEDVRVDARAALTSGGIDKNDYDRLLSEVESSRPNWYKRGSSYLSTVSGYSDLNPDPGAAQTKANMLDDWADWAQRNPKANDNEAHDAYTRIASEYSLIDRKKITAGMRQPRFLVGSRTAPDIDETERRTVKAFQKGEIDKGEFERQAELLKQWRDAMDRGGAPTNAKR